MFIKSDKGFGFNFLSDLGKPKFHNGLFYLNKNEVINYCRKNFGNNVIIFDNYYKIDVTIWINKEKA